MNLQLCGITYSNGDSALIPLTLTDPGTLTQGNFLKHFIVLVIDCEQMLINNLNVNEVNSGQWFVLKYYQ